MELTKEPVAVEPILNEAEKQSEAVVARPLSLRVTHEAVAMFWSQTLGVPISWERMAKVILTDLEKK